MPSDLKNNNSYKTVIITTMITMNSNKTKLKKKKKLRKNLLRLEDK